MKVLITGITGSGGSYLAEHILPKGGIEVVGTSRAHNPAEHKNISRIKNQVKLITVDLEDFSSLLRVLESERPEIIFHIASMANVKDSLDNPIPTVKNNINITLNLLEVLRLLKEKTGYNPRTGICSSSEIFGNAEPHNIPINEDCPLKPINPYAVSKLAQDSLSYVYYLNYGLNLIRTRMFSYFNAKRGNLFATAFAKQVLEVGRGEREFLEHGSLTSQRTMLDVRDSSEAYWLAVTKGKFGEAYNIGSLEPVSVKDILDILVKKIDRPVETKQVDRLMRLSDIAIQIPDISKFTRETGWKQQYNLSESLDFFWSEVETYWK